MADYTRATLFDSPLVQIIDNDCPGHETGLSGEEIADAHEIVFVRGGVFMLHTLRGRSLVDARTAILFNRGEAYQISHPVPGGDRCLTLVIRRDALNSLMAALDESAPDRPDAPFCEGMLPLHSQHHLTLFHIVKLMYMDGAFSDTLEVEETTLALAASVLYQQNVVYRSNHSNSRNRTANREIVERAQLAIHASFRDKVTLADLSAATFTSPYHLCRVFKAETGQTLHQVVERLRLLAALDELANRRASIAEIALDAGFASHSHFTAAFRKRFGQTPAQLNRPDTAHKLSKIMTAQQSSHPVS